jgi:hypothetical protein
MRDLIDLGALVNENRIRHFSASGAAASSGHGDALLLLKDHGCDLSLSDSFGQTPAHFAAMRGHEHILRMLSSWGVPLNSKDRIGKTPGYYAERHKNISVISFLGSVMRDNAALSWARRLLVGASIRLSRLKALRLSLEWWRLALAHLHAVSIHEQMAGDSAADHFGDSVGDSVAVSVADGHDGCVMRATESISQKHQAKELLIAHVRMWRSRRRLLRDFVEEQSQAKECPGLVSKDCVGLIIVFMYAYFICSPLTLFHCGLLCFCGCILGIFCALNNLAEEPTNLKFEDENGL